MLLSSDDVLVVIMISRVEDLSRLNADTALYLGRMRRKKFYQVSIQSMDDSQMRSAAGRISPELCSALDLSTDVQPDFNLGKFYRVSSPWMIPDVERNWAASAYTMRWISALLSTQNARN